MSSKGVTVADKQIQAAAWSKSSVQYAQNAHEGAGIMMPLIQKYVDQTGNIGSEFPAILDVASGSGEPGLSLAKALLKAKVTMTDFAEGMVAQAKNRANAQNVPNVSFAVADAEDLSAYPDKTFDVVTCNAGIMAMPHPDRALREFHRVLKEDGLCMLSGDCP